MSKKSKKAKKQIVEPQKQVIKISENVKAKAMEKPSVEKFEPYIPPSYVLPADKEKVREALAMDSTDYGYANAQFGAYGNNTSFKGYPYLAMLAQRPEFRKMSETIAREMTRQWIEVICTGNEDKSDKITAINAALRKYHVQDRFRECAEMDGLFGRGQLYIDLKMASGVSARDDAVELETPLILSPAKIPKDSLIGFNAIEPLWTYPGAYNASEPLKPDFYKPSHWYVMGKSVHKDRLLTFISREVPDILKPSYNFSGLSLSQLAEPYVDNWIRTRNSVGDMVHSFSINGIKTNMDGTLSGATDEGLFSRIDLFNRIRDNRGCFAIDKDSEEFFQFNTPLSGLDSLQAQAQEQMASVSSIPLVFLLGITPQGLNASSEGEILVFETTIHSLQELEFRHPLEQVLKVIQLSEFGEIDEEITFKFNPLREMTEKEQAEIRKLDADTDALLIDKQVITPNDALQRVANDPTSPYHGLETNSDAELDDDE